MLDNWFFSDLLKATVELTKHAYERMDERGISLRDIELALKHGWQKPGTNRRCYRNITVAAERQGGAYIVRTVWPN